MSVEELESGLKSFHKCFVLDVETENIRRVGGKLCFYRDSPIMKIMKTQEDSVRYATTLRAMRHALGLSLMLISDVDQLNDFNNFKSMVFRTTAVYYKSVADIGLLRAVIAMLNSAIQFAER